MDVVLSKFRDPWFCIPQKQKQKHIPQWAKASLFEWRERSIFDRLESGPRSCSTGDWVKRLFGNSTGPLGAAAFISLFLSASIYKGSKKARPDGICRKMLLQHWQRTYLIMVLS